MNNDGCVFNLSGFSAAMVHDIFIYMQMIKTYLIGIYNTHGGEKAPTKANI